MILTAGDNSLFVDCQSCFQAMGKSSLFFGEVGTASKVYLIMQLMQGNFSNKTLCGLHYLVGWLLGISLVGLAEGLVLADRCGISGKDIINIFNMTNMASPYLCKKATKIINKDFKQVSSNLFHLHSSYRYVSDISWSATT